MAIVLQRWDQFKGISDRVIAEEADPVFWHTDTSNVTVTVGGTCEKRPGYLNVSSADPFTTVVRGGFQILDRYVISDGATIKKTTISTAY